MLTIFAHRAGKNILDLGRGLVNILLPTGLLVLNLSLLPSTGLLHWLSILRGLKLAFMIIIGGLIVMNKLVLPLCNQGFVY